MLLSDTITSQNNHHAIDEGINQWRSQSRDDIQKGMFEISGQPIQWFKLGKDGIDCLKNLPNDTTRHLEVLFAVIEGQFQLIVRIPDSSTKTGEKRFKMTAKSTDPFPRVQTATDSIPFDLASFIHLQWNELFANGLEKIGRVQPLHTAFHYEPDQQPTKQGPRTTRFRLFKIENPGLDSIIKKVQNGGTFRIIMGAYNFLDLGEDHEFRNRFNKSYFIPIIDTNGDGHGTVDILIEDENGGGSIFDYSRPCPPTCP